LELPATGWLRRYRVRAHGAISQGELDGLRDGVTIDGIHYGPIDASLDRQQGSNVWLTLAIREGKNREVRNVLGHLGLSVTRLIRVSFGPFQLGELDQGKVEEVRTRVLREQLGDKLVRLSGADFSGPRPIPPRPRVREEARPIAPHKPREKPKHRTSSDHAWRVHEDGRSTKKLHRRFRGTRSDHREKLARDERPQTDTLTDRKGRRVAVEKYLRAPPTETVRPDERGFRGKSKHRRDGSRPGRSRSDPPSRGKR